MLLKAYLQLRRKKIKLIDCKKHVKFILTPFWHIRIRVWPQNRISPDVSNKEALTKGLLQKCGQC